MANYSIILSILALMILLSAFAERKKLPVTLVLLAGGILIGFLPKMPVIELDPEIIFLIFLPPLLFDAAFNISFSEFRTHVNTISSLAFGLVFITTLGVGIVAYCLIPKMTWPLAFLLGAILSATDAVAAISVTKGLGLSHKTLTILEGESLINDASALVAYRFAVASVTGASFVLWKAGLQFLYVLIGGFAVGLVIGLIVSWMIRYVRNFPLLINSLILLMPFVTYLIAEELHVSGVIAVVVLGLGAARLSRERFPESLKIQSKNIWDINIYLLNGLIFILLGLELHYVIRDIPGNSILPNLLYAFLITIAILLIRTVRVFLQRNNLNRAFLMKKGRITQDALLDFQTSLIVSLSGMRGIVSLAIAIGLPKLLNDGEPFPLRNEIIFISVAVILISLFGQGLLLPVMVRRMNKMKASSMEK